MIKRVLFNLGASCIKINLRSEMNCQKYRNFHLVYIILL
jgi:hypothetical protein